MPKKKNRKPFNPIVDTGEKSPVTAVVAVGDVNDRYSTYPSNGLTPKRLARILKEADQGDVMSQMELFEDIEEKDPHIFSQLQTRKLAVTGLEWTIQPAASDEESQGVANFIEAQIRKIPRFSEKLLDILDAIGKGISISELCWGVSDTGRWVIEDIEWVHPKKLIWDSETDEIKITTKDHPEGIPLPENKFVVHKYKAKSGHPARAGIMRVAAWMYLFKNYDVKDWVAFCEVFGMPLRLGKYNAAASEDDKKSLMQAIIQIGTDAAGIVPDTADIQFIESNKTTSAEIYEKLARYCDEQTSKAIVGQTLTADSGGGSYAQGKVHADVRHDLTVADAHSLQETINTYIIKPLVLFNFGADVSCPTFQFDCKNPEDLKETVEIYRTLSCDMGLKIPVNHIYQKFAIPKPDKYDECINPYKPEPAPDTQAETENLQEMKLSMPHPDTQAQEQIDKMADIVDAHSDKIFEKMFEPILKLVEETEDLTVLKEWLEDKENLKKLYEDMDSPELMDMLTQAIYLSSLVGRSS